MSELEANIQAAMDVKWGNLPQCGTKGLTVSPYRCEWSTPTVLPPEVPIPAVPLPSSGVLFAFALTVAVLINRR